MTAIPFSPPYIEGLPPYHAGLSEEEVASAYGLSRVIKLASNENPLGPSPAAVEAFCAAAVSAHRYPDPSATTLRTLVAEEHQVNPDQVIVGHGSSELIDLCCRTFASPKNHAVIGTPSFTCYRIYLQAANIPTTEVPLREQLYFNVDDLLAAVRPETRLLFLANPNNPTGTILEQESLLRLLRTLPSEVLVVVDEAYFDFVSEPGHRSASVWLKERERLIVLRTFSKAHGLAAMRIGYGVGDPELIARMNRVRLPFNMAGPSIAAAIAALGDQDHLEKAVSTAVSERGRVTGQLKSLGFRVVPSQANFFMLFIGAQAGEVYKELLRKGVIVRFFGGSLPGYLRVTVGTPEENDMFVEELKAVCSSLGFDPQKSVEAP